MLILATMQQDTYDYGSIGQHVDAMLPRDEFGIGPYVLSPKYGLRNVGYDTLITKEGGGPLTVGDMESHGAYTSALGNLKLAPLLRELTDHSVDIVMGDSNIPIVGSHIFCYDYNAQCAVDATPFLDLFPAGYGTQDAELITPQDLRGVPITLREPLWHDIVGESIYVFQASTNVEFLESHGLVRAAISVIDMINDTRAAALQFEFAVDEIDTSEPLENVAHQEARYRLRQLEREGTKYRDVVSFRGESDVALRSQLRRFPHVQFTLIQKMARSIKDTF